jgi:hypothetical protein
MAHPDWTAPRLKAALMASATDGGYPVFEQGAGRVDVARAVRQNVIAEPAAISAGRVSGPPLVAGIALRNLGDTDRTYTLALTGAGADVAGTLSVSTVTVPAGATAPFELTINPSPLDLGPYGWRIVASDATGDQVVVPVGFVREPTLHRVTLRLVNITDPDTDGVGRVVRVDDRQLEFQNLIGLEKTADPAVQEADLIVPEGVHQFALTAVSRAPNGRRLLADLVHPEVSVRGATTVTFDLAKTVPIKINTPVPTEETTEAIARTRTTQQGIVWSDWLMTSEGGWTDLRVLPAAKPTIGAFKLLHHHVLTAPQVTLRLDGNGGTDLRPVYLTYGPSVPKFRTDQHLVLATEDDLRSGRDVRGRLVYIETGTHDPSAEIALAVEAGAAGVLAASAFVPSHLAAPEFQELMAIPLLWLDLDQAAAVRRQLGAHRITADVRAQLTSPFEYKLPYYELDRIPDRLTYLVRHPGLTTVWTAYHREFAGRPDLSEASETSHTFRPEDVDSFVPEHFFDAPVRRIEYYRPTGRDVLWRRSYTFFSDDHDADNAQQVAESFRGFPAVADETEDWNKPVLLGSQVRPGPHYPVGGASIGDFTCLFCRQGGKIYPQSWITGDGDPSHNVFPPSSAFDFHLYAGGEEIALARDDRGAYWPVSDGDTAYRLTLATEDAFAGKRLAKTTTTTWSFRSAAPDVNNVEPPHTCFGGAFGGHSDPCGWLPVIYPQYDLPLALDNTAPAGRHYSFTIRAAPAAPAGAAAVVGARVWVSYRNGSTQWTEVPVSGDNGVFRVRLRHPALSNTDGAVSIRTEIWDTAGNRVEQVIDRAYGLRR